MVEQEKESITETIHVFGSLDAEKDHGLSLSCESEPEDVVKSRLKETLSPTVSVHRSSSSNRSRSPPGYHLQLYNKLKSHEQRMVFNALEWNPRTRTFPKLSNKQAKVSVNLDNVRIESEVGAKDEYRLLNYRSVCNMINQYEGKSIKDPEENCKSLWGSKPRWAGKFQASS